MTEQVLTVRCKLKPSETHVVAIEETLKTFADACTWINQNVDPKIRGKIRIQHLIYQDVRAKYVLSSNLTIRAIARVAANRKRQLVRTRSKGSSLPVSTTIRGSFSTAKPMNR